MKEKKGKGKKNNPEEKKRKKGGKGVGGTDFNNELV